MPCSVFGPNIVNDACGMPNIVKHYKLDLIAKMSDIDPEEWDSCLSGPKGQPGAPFLSHAFLNALEISQSANSTTGWIPRHLILRKETNELVAACPLYMKSHSQGEYVFDHTWAQAFERAGGDYYPKLQCAVPFSPVTGPRLLASAEAADCLEYRKCIAQGLIDITRKMQLSSLHVTFCTKADADLLKDQGFLIRHDTQFHWENDNYDDFESFLGALTSRKRKNIRKERRFINESGICIRMLTGNDIEPHHWDAFFKFYIDTYDKKWGYPYLTRDFFTQLGETMAGQILLVLAYRDRKPIAGAINFFDDQALYGRNWGCCEEHKYLHFETCYYAAIDFAISRNLKRVEAGTHGQHKLQRGYTPKRTYSAHWIVNENFRNAVAQYLEEETKYRTHEASVLKEFTPFRKI